ncbi:MAG: hypothetical protein J5J00_08345 [Deltaproteobacteria bacterium]|nr:hypothetical protein [Deltaproteobacteria bacterium]
MFGPKIKIRPALMEKLKQAAEIVGCSSVNEYAEKVLESESAKVLASSGKSAISKEALQDITHKLKGLGYLE